MFQKSSVFIAILTLLAAFSWFTEAAAAQFVQDGMAAYWTFDADTIEGDTVKDVWGDHDGTIFGDPELVTGQVGQALKFDEQEDYIEVPDSEEFKISGKAVSVEAWIKIEALPASYSMILSKRGTEYMFAINSVGEPGCYFLGDNTAGAGKMTLSEGLWYHVVWIWDESSGQANVYVDSNEILDYVTADTSPDSAAPVTIARDPGTADASKYHYNGIIDELRFYSRVLNEMEIRQNFLAKGFAVTASGKLTTFWGQIKISQYSQR